MPGTMGQKSGDEHLNKALKESDFKEIGRLSRFTPEIDPPNINLNNMGRVSTEMMDKMTVIDLFPCGVNAAYGTALKIFNGDKSIIDGIKDALRPNLIYEKSINKYKEKLEHYGLDPVSFLRLYLTDMTTNSDEISNTYGRSVAGDAAEVLFNNKYAQTFHSVTKAQGGIDHIGEILKNLPIIGESIKGNVEGLTEFISHGTKINFPKIWNATSYEPNLQANLKLACPYGHPEAVSEFIIKPIGYLLILLTPTTKAGIGLLPPSYLTMKSYGLSNMSLCFPKDIQIRRGGDSSSFNIYKQPLTVEVSLTFQSSTEGFATFDADKDKSEENEGGYFVTGNLLEDFSENTKFPRAFFPTLGSMVDSFKPYHPKYLKDSSNLRSAQVFERSTNVSVAKDSIYYPSLNDD